MAPQECPVCEQTYNNENRRPLVLPCNHSFCQRCLQGVKASTNPVCPMCRYDLSRSSIQDFVFCHQLVPDEDELKKKEIEKNKNKVEGTKEKARNVCKQHEDLDYLFWCKFCNCPACMKCLVKMHKNCDWVLMDDRVRNLSQEFDECLRNYSEQVRVMHRAGFANRHQLEAVKRAIGSLKALEEQLEMYYGLLASVNGDAEDCLDELLKCKEDAISGAVDPLVLLMLKVEITAKLQDLLRMPDQPDMPLLHLLENYEASVNMALQPDAKRSRPEFPSTLAGFGYRFHDGKLQNVETGEGFNFMVKENNHAYNQAHYEALGEVLNEHVYDLLTQECGLKRSPVPIEGNGDKHSSFIFVSDNWKTCNRLMVLIHGSGVVRAGQWARRLIINDSLNSGTQMPYIHRAKSEGYGVLVLNTNYNRAVDSSVRTWSIRGSEDPTSHADTVWRQYVLHSAANHIAIVAHSYGGCVATHLFTQFTNDFNKRVFAVALTDSVHMINSPGKFQPFMKLSRNWVTSNLPLDTEMSRNRPMDVPMVSAGVTAHEMTSWGSFNSVFEFFSNRYHDKTNERIPKVSEEHYLFYPPSPPVRQNLQMERAESLPLSGQPSLSSASDVASLSRDRSLPTPPFSAIQNGEAVGHQVAEPISGASYQGAVGGGDHDDDGQEESSEDERHRRRRSESRKERKDQESGSDRGRHHRNDRLQEGRDDGKPRSQHREERHKEKEEKRGRHHRRNEGHEKSERDEDEVRNKVERRRPREEKHEEKEDREIIGDSERSHHSKDGRKEEQRDSDEEKIERRRRRKERHEEKEDQEIIGDSERSHHSKDGRKGEQRDSDEEKIERRREERHEEKEDREIIGDSERSHHSKDGRKGEQRDSDEEKIERRREERHEEKEDREIIGDSERSHHSKDGRKKEQRDSDEVKIERRRRREERRIEREGHDSEHSHRSNKGQDQDSDDHSHNRSDNSSGVDRRHGHEANSDNCHSSRRHNKKHRDDERRGSNRINRHYDEDGNGAEGDNRQSIHKREDREGKKDVATLQQDQNQKQSQEGDRGSGVVLSGDEKGARGGNDSTVDHGRSGYEDKSGDEDQSGDEDASCEEYFTPPDAMEQDKKDAKSTRGGSAIQNGSADKDGQTVAKDRASEGCAAAKDGQGVYAETKRAEPAEVDASQHRTESGASDR